MKNRNIQKWARGRWQKGFPAVWLGIGFGVSAGMAQQVLMPRPEIAQVPPALQQFQTNEMTVFLPEGGAAGYQPEAPLVQWGPVGLRPHLFYRFLDGDGIPAAGTNHVNTMIHEFSPGLLLGIGRHWILDYTPTWRRYSSDQFRNTLDHNVALTGGTTYEDWIFGLSQNYSSSSAPLVETGTQTDQETYTTALSGSYRFNSKVSLDLALNQVLSSAQNFTSYREWSTLDWLNYQFWPRLNAAFGAGFGYVDVASGSDMTYERFQGRLNWRATDKVSFQVHGGLEDRQFLSGGSDQLNPIAGGLIQYQPFETTRLVLTADRVVAVSLVSASASQDQITESTDVGGALTQRLLHRLYLDLGGGFHRITYVGSSTGSTGRRDDYYSFNARLTSTFLKRGTVAVFYQTSDNSSSASGFTFSSTQIGAEVGWRY